MVRPEVLDEAELELVRAAPRGALARSLSAAGLGGARRGGNAEKLVRPAADPGRGARRAVCAGARTAGCAGRVAIAAARTAAVHRGHGPGRSVRTGQRAAEAEDVMSPDQHRPRFPPWPVPRARARGGPVDRRSEDPDRGVLRGRRGRQDDHRGGARAARRRARPQGGRAHHRPGPPARPVHGHRLARQRPAPGQGRRGRRRTARHDARHEADLRRDRRGARRRRAGRRDPRQPLLPVALGGLRGHAGVHGDGEAGAAAVARRVGPDRRRHPSVPVRAGLPGRPEAARLVPRRQVHPAADGAGEARRARRE